MNDLINFFLILELAPNIQFDYFYLYSYYISFLYYIYLLRVTLLSIVFGVLIFVSTSYNGLTKLFFDFDS